MMPLVRVADTGPRAADDPLLHLAATVDAAPKAAGVLFTGWTFCGATYGTDQLRYTPGQLPDPAGSPRLPARKVCAACQSVAGAATQDNRPAWAMP